jgi:hypothetical protein
MSIVYGYLLTSLIFFTIFVFYCYKAAKQDCVDYGGDVDAGYVVGISVFAGVLWPLTLFGIIKSSTSIKYNNPKD